jgi:hypothetical protein
VGLCLLGLRIRNNNLTIRQVVVVVLVRMIRQAVQRYSNKQPSIVASSL